MPLCPPPPAGPLPSARAGSGPMRRAASAPAASAAPRLTHTPSVSTLAPRARALRLGALSAGGDPALTPCVLRKPSAVLPLRRCQGGSLSCGPQPGAPTAGCSPNRRRRCCGPLSPRRWHAIPLYTELMVSRVASPRSLLSTRVRSTARKTGERGRCPTPHLQTETSHLPAK